MINFGNVIKKYRVVSDFTQKDLAQKVNITAEYLSAIENGHKEPSLKLLAELCRALNLPQEVLFWEAIEITDNISDEDKKIIETAKVLIRYYFENRTQPPQDSEIK